MLLCEGDKCCVVSSPPKKAGWQSRAEGEYCDVEEPRLGETACVTCGVDKNVGKMKEFIEKSLQVAPPIPLHAQQAVQAP